MPIEFYLEFRAWKNSEAGPAALRHHFETMSLGDFDPASPAPWTRAKQAMARAGKTDVGSWVAALKEDPDSVLRVGGLVVPRALWTGKERRGLYDPDGKHRITTVGLGRELAKAGFRQVCNEEPVRANGVRDRYYAVRDRDAWARATLDACRRHLEERPPPAKVKKFRKDV